MAANIKGLALYPLAFGSLVLSKGQNIAKSSLVPAVVDDESELVRANSRLQLISVLAGTLGAGVAAGFLKTVGGSWVLRAGAFVFVGACIASFRIPRAQRVGPPETTEQRRELQSSSIVVAGTAMGLLRGAVGFMTFFVGFLLKKQHEAAWVYGLVLSLSATGNGVGVVLAPVLRRKIREEWILSGSILMPAVLLVFAARSSGRVSLSIAAFSIAGGAACGRLVFDSLVQRDATTRAGARSPASRPASRSCGSSAVCLQSCSPARSAVGCSSSPWCCSSPGSRTSVRRGGHWRSPRHRPPTHRTRPTSAKSRKREAAEGGFRTGIRAQRGCRPDKLR